MDKKDERQLRRGVEVCDIRWELDGSSIDDAITVLTNRKAEAADKGFSNVSIYIDEDYGSIRFRIVGDRPETDAEQEGRINQENARKKWQEDRDKAEFERLSKKFGGKP